MPDVANVSVITNAYVVPAVAVYAKSNVTKLELTISSGL